MRKLFRESDIINLKGLLFFNEKDYLLEILNDVVNKEILSHIQ